MADPMIRIGTLGRAGIKEPLPANKGTPMRAPRTLGIPRAGVRIAGKLTMNRGIKVTSGTITMRIHSSNILRTTINRIPG